jgi:phage tail tape-measure protein
LIFDGGCAGNLQGLSRLADGRPAEEIADLLSDVTCGQKDSSCPAQLSLALRSALSRKGAAETRRKTETAQPSRNGKKSRDPAPPEKPPAERRVLESPSKTAKTAKKTGRGKCSPKTTAVPANPGGMEAKPLSE